MTPITSTAVCAGNEASTHRAGALAQRVHAPLLEVEWHRFPDGETGVRVAGEVPERIIVFADLAQPDPKFLPLTFLLDALRELGARHITLVVPYLPYLRQDARFRAGEAITSRTFARIVSQFADRLVTIDPHLHRYRQLEDVYDLDGAALSAAGIIGEWIRGNVQRPLLVGPDSESRQWVERAATAANAEFVVLEKVRRGDRDVSVTLPETFRQADRTPVLVDDIVSSGHTMSEAVRALRARNAPAPVCVSVHALFADDAEELLRDAGAMQVVSTNTIPHASNAIDILDLLAVALRAG